MMKKLMFLVVICFVCSMVGCGPQAKELSTPPPSDEEVNQDIEKAMESGEIDPATYGQEG